jgi:uncharacterized protein YegJ (DUF2314 family)
MKKRRARRPAAASDRKLYAGLGVVVAGLGALVWWSLPGNHAPDPAPDPGEAMAKESPAAEPARARTLERPRATAELAVVTDQPEEIVRGAATVAEIAEHLDVRHCGGACDAVRKFLSDEDAFEIDVWKTDDLLLPPKDTLDVVAPRLTPSERAGVHARPRAVVLRAQGPFTPEHLPARAIFAAAAVLAERLDGFVYDEVARRIEARSDFAAHTITAKLGEPAFARKHIVIQLYRQDDGTARLLTLGMARFGTPDLSIRGATMASGPVLAEVINATARLLAHGESDTAITITLDDVAAVVGKKPSELHPNPSAARPVTLDLREPERVEGDPDNDMMELVPRGDGGDRREAWDEVVASLFGVAPSVQTAVGDEELAAIAKKAQRELPKAIARFEAGEGTLFVKGPFSIPEDRRVDGGATTELLWLEAASCDARACTGVLSNEPTYATNLALGKTTSVRREDAVDWVIQARDGGVVGGESIKALQRRGAR